MRLYYNTGVINVSLYDIEKAIDVFVNKYKVNPLTIKMRHDTLRGLYSVIPKTIAILEKGKQYGQFYPIPGGMIELIIDESVGAEIVNFVYEAVSTEYIVLENNSIDEAFEKILVEPS